MQKILIEPYAIRLKKHREMIGKSQAEFSKELEVSLSYYTKLEQGKREPSLSLAKLIYIKTGANPLL